MNATCALYSVFTLGSLVNCQFFRFLSISSSSSSDSDFYKLILCEVYEQFEISVLMSCISFSITQSMSEILLIGLLLMR